MSRVVSLPFGMNQPAGGTYGPTEAPGWYDGAPTFATSPALNSPYSAKYGNGQSGYFQHGASQSGNLVKDRTYYYRFYVSFEQAPSVNWWTFFHLLSIIRLQMDTDRTVRLYNTGTSAAIGSASSALALNTKHRIEIALNVNTTAASSTISLKINGTTVVNNVTTNIGSVPSYFVLGDYLGLSPFTGGNGVWFGAMALNDDQGAYENTWVGDTTFSVLLPASDNTRTGWTAGAGATTSLYDALNNRPPTGSGTPTDAAQIKNVNSNATDNLDLNMQTYTAGSVPTGNSVRLVQPFAQVAFADTTTRSLALDVIFNPASAGEVAGNPKNAAGAAASASPTNWRTIVGPVVYLPNVTRGSAPIVRIGRRDATAGTMYADFVGLLVETGPVTTSLTSSDAWGWSDTATSAPPSRIVKTESGRISADDCTLSDRFKTSGSYSASPSASGGEVILIGSDSADHHWWRVNYDRTNYSNQTPDSIRVVDAVVSLDISNIGANNGPFHLGIYKDDSNYYEVAVPTTAGGTATMSDVKSGSKTSRGTVAKGVAASAKKKITLRKIGSKLSARVDGSTITEWTDGSPLSGVCSVRFGVPNNGSGTSDWRVDNIAICGSDKIRMRNLPTGYGIRIYDQSDTVLASATESSGVATLDLSALDFPITGYVKVFSDGGTWASPQSNSRFPSLGTNDFYGGDEYTFDLSGYSVIGTDFASLYSTSQVNSHNGAVLLPDGRTLIGAAFGGDGSVRAWRRYTDAGVGNPTETWNIAPRRTIEDQHQPCNFLRTSDGYFHVTYGGYGASIPLYYSKSNNPNDPSSWTTPTIVGYGLGTGMIADQDDNLYLVGNKQWSDGYNSQIVCLKKPAGGSWSDEQVLADAYASTIIRKTLTTTTSSAQITVADPTGIVSGMQVCGPGIGPNITVSTVIGTTVYLTGYIATGKTSVVITFTTPPTGMLYLFDIAIGKESSGQQSIYVTAADYDVGNATFKRVFMLHSRDGASTWRGLNAGTYTLPLQQASTFKTPAEVIRDVDGSYETRICVDTDNETVHLIMWDLVAAVPKYISGTRTSGWSSPSYSFTGINTHGAMEQVGAGEYVYVASIVANPNNLLKRYRLRGGSWDSGTSMLSGPPFSPLGTQWYWPKVTPGAATYVWTIWQGRGIACYTSDILNTTVEGESSLFIAKVSAVPVVASADVWGWSETATRRLGRVTGDTWGWSDAAVPVATSRTSSDTWGWSDSASRTTTTGSSRSTADSWGWSDSVAKGFARSRTSTDTWAWTDSAARSPATRTRTASDTWHWSESATRSVSGGASKATIIYDTYVTSAQFGERTVSSDMFGTRTSDTDSYSTEVQVHNETSIS